MRIPRKIAGSVLVILVIAVLFGIKTYKAGSEKHFDGSVALDAARTKGNPAALVKVVEYTDFQCPACARASVVLENAFKKYPGKIFLEHKHFPLSMHAHARRASIYAECSAQQGKFWPFYDVLFNSQNRWESLAAVDAYFGELAVSLGMDGVKLSVCVNGGVAEKRVQQDVAGGDARGVKSTPTFLVNGKVAVGAAQFTEALEGILGKK